MPPTHLKLVPPADDKLLELKALIEAAARRSCPGWLRPQLDDVVQAAWIKTVALMQTKDMNASYVKRTAYCAVIDEIRRIRRLREDPLESSPALPSERPMDNPERRAAGTQTASAIDGCIQALGAARKHPVVLYLTGHTVPEIARLLGHTTKKTEHNVYRGISDLRSCLTRKGVTP